MNVSTVINNNGYYVRSRNLHRTNLGGFIKLNSEFLESAKSNNIIQVKALLDMGADVDAEYTATIDIFNQEPRSALGFAAKNGNIEMVNLILDYKYIKNINLEDKTTDRRESDHLKSREWSIAISSSIEQRNLELFVLLLARMIQIESADEINIEFWKEAQKKYATDGLPYLFVKYLAIYKNKASKIEEFRKVGNHKGEFMIKEEFLQEFKKLDNYKELYRNDIYVYELLRYLEQQLTQIAQKYIKDSNFTRYKGHVDSTTNISGTDTTFNFV